MVMNKHKVKSLKNIKIFFNVNTRIYGIWKYLYTRSTLLNCSDILFWYHKADLIEVIAIVAQGRWLLSLLISILNRFIVWLKRWCRYIRRYVTLKRDFFSSIVSNKLTTFLVTWHFSPEHTKFNFVFEEI